MYNNNERKPNRNDEFRRCSSLGYIKTQHPLLSLSDICRHRIFQLPTWSQYLTRLSDIILELIHAKHK